MQEEKKTLPSQSLRVAFPEVWIRSMGVDLFFSGLLPARVSHWFIKTDQASLTIGPKKATFYSMVYACIYEYFYKTFFTNLNDFPFHFSKLTMAHESLNHLSLD